MDSVSMRQITELARTHDYQVWVERVDESGLVGIVIDEGEVVADNR